VLRNSLLRLFQPGWWAAAAATATTSQPFKSQDCLFNLFALEAQFRQHFIDVQNLFLPAFIIPETELK
jgi:hypothetical protein